MSYRRFTFSVVVTGVAVAVGGLTCVNMVNVESCPEEAEDATGVNVAGVFRYSGQGLNAGTGGTFELSGTISFEQEENRARVVDTTYDFSGLRRLESEFAELRGNRLNLALSPRNGDADYQAAVKFVFSLDGDEFCVEFMDTNNDQGGLGSFRGVRQEP